MAARLVAYLVACIVGVTFIAGLIVGAQREDDGAVDLIVVNGRVYAGDGADQLAEAVAVRGNKVIRVGTNREIQRLRRAQTTVIDAKGGAVVPGFNDAHAHFISGGLALGHVSLRDARTLDEIKDTVRVWAEAHPEREWVVGGGWHDQPFAGALPTRQLLDVLVPDRPAYLTARGGHAGWANSRALKLAGITRRTKNPVNGTVVRDPRTGEPTGVLKDSAMQLMLTAAPQATLEDKVAAIRAGIGEAHRFGVTSVQNAGGSPGDLELYDELRKRGELTLRVYQALSANASLSKADLDRLDQVRTRFADDPLLKTGAVKLIADGAIESHTAAMLEPYSNQPASTGHAEFTAVQLDQVVAMLDRRGWQVMTHAAGDAAVRMALDAYASATKANPAPERGRRHRIEHAELIGAADIKRFGPLGVIALMQPLRGLANLTPGEVWSTNIGPERAARGWMWSSIARADGKLAFGSNWPAMTIDPLVGLHAAVNRTALDALPASVEASADTSPERLSLRRAIDAYTRDAAWASYDELRKGTLARDMLADLVVFSEDIFDLSPERILDAHVVITIVDGQVVYRRDAPDTTTH